LVSGQRCKLHATSVPAARIGPGLAHGLRQLGSQTLVPRLTPPRDLPQAASGVYLQMYLHAP
ncbi:MAG: hypothetical protein WBL53_10390, partial [Pseudonocardiaceae bacterium]